MSDASAKRSRPAPVVRLAFGNIRANGWMNFKLCFVFSCLAFLICLFTGYNASLAGKREEIVRFSVSAQYVAVSSGSPKSFPYDFTEEHFPGQEGTGYYRSSLYMFVNNVQQNNINTTLCRYISFFADGEELAPADDTFRLNCYSANFPFTEDDKAELLARTGSDECLIGRRPETENEIVLAETMLKNYGLGRDALGSEIAVQIKGASSPLLTGTLVGIVKEEYYTLTGHSGWSGHHLPIMMVCENHPLYQRNYTYTVYFRLGRLYTRSEMKALYEDAEERFGTGWAGFVAYGGAEQSTTLWMLDNILTLANTLYIIIGSALAVGLVLTVFLMIDKYVKVFARKGGILMASGLSRRGLFAVLIAQLLLLGLFTVPLSVFLTGAGYIVVGVVMKLATGVAMEITVGRLAVMLTVGLAAVMLIAAAFFTYMTFRIRKKTVKELLVTEVN